MSADGSAALRRVESLAPAAIAILDGTAAPTHAGRMTPRGRAEPRRWPIATGRVVGYGPDTLAVVIDAPGRGVVVVNEAFYPGWRATVDHAPAPIHRANALVRAVPVDAGTHTLRMRYAPALARALRWLSLAALLVGLALLAGPACLAWLHRRGDRRAPPSRA